MREEEKKWIQMNEPIMKMSVLIKLDYLWIYLLKIRTGKYYAKMFAGVCICSENYTKPFTEWANASAIIVLCLFHVFRFARVELYANRVEIEYTLNETCNIMLKMKLIRSMENNEKPLCAHCLPEIYISLKRCENIIYYTDSDNQ